MTINDLEVNELIRKIHSEGKNLDMYMRDGKEMDLVRALSLIEYASKEAQKRLNKIKCG